MTSGETEETCGGQEQGGRGGGEGGGSTKLSVTALSTIAIQAGQSQMVVSILKSGSLVHLQLVQIHPALCEIGSSHEETQTLIKEQQQLIDKLKKHEDEVLSVVEKNQQTEERRRRRIWDEGMMKRSKKQEEEEAVHRAMTASVKEGWMLLLRLLQRRQEVLTLAADFYSQALEFANSIDRLEALQIGSNDDDNDGDRLTQQQLTYDSMRKDLLGKSLKVLNSSSVLLHKLRQLQRTEALQRRGGVLQEEEEEEEESSQSSQSSRGVVLRLEQLVESLQERRRMVDQAVKLQLQQVEKCTIKEPTSFTDKILTINEILNLELESRSTSAESLDLRSEYRSSESVDLRSESRSEDTGDLQPESKSEKNIDLKTESRSEETKDLKRKSRSEETKDLKLKLGSEETKDLQLKSGSDLWLESRSEETKDLKLKSGSVETKDLKPKSRSGLWLESSLEKAKDIKSESRSGLWLESSLEKAKDIKSESRSDLWLKCSLEEPKDIKPESRSEETRSLTPESTSEETEDLKPLSISEETRDVEPESRSDLKSSFKPEETRDLQPPPRLDQMLGSRSDLKPESRLDVKTESRTEPNRDMAPGSTSQETRNIESGCGLHLKPETRSEDSSDLMPESKSDLQSGFKSDMQAGFRLELKTESRPAENQNEMSGSRSEESRNIESGFRLHLKDLKFRLRSENTGDLKLESRSELKPESRLVENKNKISGSRSEESTDLKPESKSELKPESRPAVNIEQMSGSKSKEFGNIKSGCKLQQKTEFRSALKPKFEDSRDLNPESRSVLKPESRLVDNRNQMSESKLEVSRNIESGCRLHLKPESKSELKPESRPAENRNQTSGKEESRNIKLGNISHLKPRSRSEDTIDLKPEEAPSELKPEYRPGKNREQVSEFRSDLKPVSKQEETRDLQPESRSEESRNIKSGNILPLKPRFISEDTRDPKPEEIRSELKPESRPAENSDQVSGSRSQLRPDSKQDKTRDLRPESRSEKTKDLQPESRSEEIVDSGLKSGSSVQVAELEAQSGEDHAHQTLLTNQRLQLLSSCEQLLDKICSWVQQSSSVLSNSCEAVRELSEAEDTLNTHLQLRTQAESAGHDAENLKQILDQVRALHTTRQLSPLKALTEQLKRGSTDRRTRTDAALPGPPMSPELIGRVDLVLKDLESLNNKIDSNLQLLKPYVTFLRMAQQVEQELEEMREIYKRPKEDEAGSSRSSVKKKKKKHVDACWPEVLQRFLTCQELGNDYIHTATTVSGAALNLQSLVSAVQESMERLSRTKQEVIELQSKEQIQIQQQQDYCRKYWEKLHKTLQDLNCVSEMLDSCTLMDLGSDLQTSRLQQHFSQARPHFTQLDVEVEFMVKSWETVREVQETLEVEELKGGAVKEEDLSELLKLQERVKNKIHQSESILDLTSSFHLTSKQLEALLQSDPGNPLTGSTGSSEAEQIQNMFKKASTLKTEICTAVNHTGGTCFRVQQLEARLLSLDSLCVSWQNEAARREEEKLRRELLTRLLSQDINQLRDSFKELKKRFSNLRFNYLKRNDRTRNTKAVRNQLQQVEMYEEKLQALRKRLQGVAARLGSEVKDGGVAREAEDAVNELQRQMGEFERSVSEHQKTLEMTCKLQQAMEEYQFWCEDASATITRVGKFSSECRSTEAVSVLYRQFEKFVWPTVPQQEERISQITELAVRLHGAEEGQRFIEKTVSKHSEMVESIRELSDGLMALEAKLKLESIKQQQVDREKEMKEEKEKEEEVEEKDEEKEKKWKENRKLKKEQTDNRSTQEANDVCELKETGHTPELTTLHDGKEVPVKRQIATNRKPPLQKSRSQDADSRPSSSFCSTHTFSLSCSPAEANRRIHAIHSQSQATTTQTQATPPPAVIGPLFSDIQREFQRKETSNMDASAGGLSEAELQQQEVMTEDSFSNDEYDCASPDDISLPPLAETPESYMLQSDIEEGFCFSSHSVHINQYSRQSEHSGAGIGTGAVPQQKESIQNESCPTPPTRNHSSTRFRLESSSFVQSPLTVPAPSVLTTSLCSILKTGKTSTVSVSQSVDLSLGAPEPSFPSGSNPDHKRKTPDNCSNKEINVPEKTSSFKTDFILKEHRCQNKQPQRSVGPLGKTTKNIASKEETLPQTDPIPQVAELNQGTTLPQSSDRPQTVTVPDPDLHRDKTPQDTEFLKCSTTLSQTSSICQENSFPQSFHDPENDHNQDLNSSQIQKETSSVPKPQQDNSPTSTSTKTKSQQSIHFQSSLSDSHRTLPQVNPVHLTRGISQGLKDSVLHENKTQDTRFFKSSGATSLQTTTTFSQDNNTSQSDPDSRSGLDKDIPSPQTSKETPSVFMPKSSFTTATTVTQQTVYCQSSPSDSHFNVPQTSSNLKSQQECSSVGEGLPEASAPNSSEPNSISSISISSSTTTSSNRFNSKQSHQTVYSFHESLTSTSTQQCVHDPGMTPGSTAKPAAPPPPEPHTQALAQQANPHVIPLSSSLHLLTPDQDPNICQPVTIREEIMLTPQIQGPSLPAPPAPPQAQTESLPQGKASKPGPPCFTRPLSRATVMEGSPVLLEVEVTAQPEPSLTWCTDGEPGPGRPPPSCEDGEHFLLTPEVSDSDDVWYEARAAEHPSSSSSSDKWLVEEVFDIISEDVQTWFGTLCVLLWLLYLILL